MKIPWGTPTVSSATAIGYTNLEQSILGLLFLPVIVDDFANLDAWTEVDSASNVNLADGVVTMNGNNTYNGNGIFLTAGLTRGRGYAEVKFNCSTSVYYRQGFYLNNLAALVTSITGIGGPGFISHMAESLTAWQDDYGGAAGYAGRVAILPNTWYTLRIYVDLSKDGATWKKVKFAIIGGIYSSETSVGEVDLKTTAWGTTIYPTLQRYANSAAQLTSYKEFRWNSGYSTASPYIEWIADAGVGKTWQNFDRTAITFPAGFPTTNMTFSDSFDDGTEAYSVAAALATWQAVGKTTANRRYIRLRAYLVSDGATAISAPVCGPNSDTGTDIKDLTTAEEAARNTATPNGDADVLAGQTWKRLNILHTGTLTAVTAPSIPVITTVKNITPTSAIVVISPQITTDSLKIYKDGVLVASGVTTLEYSLTGLIPGTSYSITAKATNLTGDSAASTAYVFSTTASDASANASLLSAATVAVVTVTGAPKIVGHGSAKIFDVRTHPVDLSLATIDYYWKDVMGNKGRSVLPEDR